MRTLTIPLHHQMDRLLNDMLGANCAPVAPRTGHLAWDLSEDEEALHLAVDLPGVASEHVELTLEDQVLKLQVQRPAVEGARPRLRERWEGTRSRSLALPVPVDGSKIRAELKEGVLRITLPKAPEARSHRIQIQEN